MAIPKAPDGARTAGRRLWRSVLAEFELAEHELALLRQAVRVADECERLQERVDAEGPLIETRLCEQRTHPALIELRNQRVLLARLIVALRVPLGEADDEPQGRQQVRAIRGVYGVAG